MVKKRLDVLVVDKNLIETREQAQRSIMAGEILINDIRITKPGTKVDEDCNIRYTGKAQPYISRGGLKLKKAIDAFAIDFTDKIVIDIGASTGGFTDCALKHGAVKVYSVDVGYGQLAWTLRNDPRVVVMERTNARSLTQDMFPQKVDIITMDVAFISITKIIPQFPQLIKDDGIIITLIKPQFEAGKDNVGKKGVVKDPEVHKSVIKNVISQAEKVGLYAKKLEHSPIRGPEGNIEFLLLLEPNGNSQVNEELINRIVEDSHQLN